MTFPGPPVPAGTVTLSLADLHASLGDPVMASMNMLSEIAERHPDAISFASGSPYEGYFDTESLHRHLRTFCDHLAHDRGMDEAQVTRTLFQYGRTKGVITDLLATYLARDENIHVDPESLVVTVGCQEAILLVLRALRRDARDVVLTVSPSYVGLTGAARLLDMTVVPVREGPLGIDLDDLTEQLRRTRADGLRPRALYLVPDFSNPSGRSLDLATRHRLLALAEEADILLLEDNPYGLYTRAETRPPTLKALDTRRRVVYLGSLAKTGLPGARVGFAVADQPVTGAGPGGLLADQLSTLKSMVTVNTSPLAQAVIGGKLLENDCRLSLANRRETEIYRHHLDCLLNGLDKRWPAAVRARLGIDWNVPGGGFFVVLTVPFRVDDELLARSARRHGVLWMPMHHFYAGDGGHRQLRLSYSRITPERIDEGLDRLKALVDEECRAR
ncbi:aminotransferase-like domain-containing protein [Streptomyces celluloflavus]|uniref:aminotransferase-like domain-containing protein n=1 Tax=Streptomyces celluloflavus TaxID=58344 RepID=UPI0036A85AF0